MSKELLFSQVQAEERASAYRIVLKDLLVAIGPVMVFRAFESPEDRQAFIEAANEAFKVVRDYPG